MKKSNIYLVASITLFSSFALAGESALNTPFYLELGTGASINSAKEWSSESTFNSNIVSHKTSSALSAAVGYIYSPNVRFDFNVTYIPQWNISEYYTANTTSGPVATSYNTNINSLVTTVNAYYDITKLSSKGLTPYVIGGLGMSNNQVNGVDFYANQDKAATLYSNNNYSFAWNLGAGINYQMNDRMSVGLGYKFLSLGKVTTKSGYEEGINSQDQSVQQSTSDQVTFKNIYAQQVMLNMRIKF